MYVCGPTVYRRATSATWSARSSSIRSNGISSIWGTRSPGSSTSPTSMTSSSSRPKRTDNRQRSGERVTADYLACLRALGVDGHRPDASSDRAHRRYHRDHADLIDKSRLPSEGTSIRRHPRPGIRQAQPSRPRRPSAGGGPNRATRSAAPRRFALWRVRAGELGNRPWGPPPGMAYRVLRHA